MDERALSKKLKKRSRSALETAICEFTPYVSAVILRTVSGRACREDLEELTADVFLTLWLHLDELDPEQGVRAWLAAVAHNKATDWLRARRVCEPLSEDAADPAEGPEEQAERREWSARLWEAVNALPMPDSELFIRYYYEGEKLKIAAKALGISQSSAKQKLYRGRKALKARLAEGAGGAEGVESK